MFFPVTFMWRLGRQVSPKILSQAFRLWIIPGLKAVEAHRRRLAEGKLFPPFFFIALTDACNLHCTGCWITSQGKPRQLSLEAVNRMISQAKKQGNRFFVLLGGEPFLYAKLLDVLQTNPDCYFLIITNGLVLQEETVSGLRRLGNATILVSLDGFQAENDARRGEGSFARIVEGMERLRHAGLLFGVATTITAGNIETVLTEDYVKWLAQRGAMYLWYYIYRPVGPHPAYELALDRGQILEVRKRLLQLRRRSPLLIIDTYWDENGRAFCPAARGLGYHIGPSGDIEICPPLSFARENIRDNDYDVFRSINESQLLRDFQDFANSRTQGCVILECPQDLVAFLKEHEARDTSGRDAYAELASGCPRASHYLPDEEMPETSLFYRWMKKKLFFGLAAYG